MVSFQKKFMKEPANLKEEKQLLFLKRLHRLLDNGYSLTDALEAIKWDKNLSRTAELIIGKLKQGAYVDEAFKAAEFHPAIVSYLYFVRFNGDILTSMDKCIEMFDHRMKSYGKFKQVIRYPAVLFGFFLLLLIFLKWSVLPAFAEMFQSSDASSNSIMLSITIINIFSTTCILTVLVGLIAAIFWKERKKHIPVEKRIQIYNRIPVFRHFLKMQTSYYLTTHMGMFLKTGMSMKNVISHMTKQRELPLIAYYAELMQEHLQHGFYIDQLLEEMIFIESQVAGIFKNNNNIADLEQDLTAYGEFLTETMESKIMRLITLIQPVFFTLLAGLIIFVYLTLMWPMFQLINTI